MSYVRWGQDSNWYAFPTDVGDGVVLALWHCKLGHPNICADDCREIIAGDAPLDVRFTGELSESDRAVAMEIIDEFVEDVDNGEFNE
jgi:hypothetical protein